MRVLLYSNAFLPNLGGLERNTATLARTLVAFGHSVVVLTETPPGAGADDQAYRVVRSSSMSVWREAVRQCDVVLMNGGLAVRLVAVALVYARPYGIVYQTHLGYRRVGHGLASRVQNHVRERLAERALFNVFTSEYSRVDARLATSPTYTLLNPVDEDLLAALPPLVPEPRGGLPVILFAGRVIDGKGVFVLADAVRQLDGDHTAVVRFVGDGPALPALTERLAGLKTIRPEISGRLEGADLMRAYRDACVLVVPSTTHQEGNPLVIAEAISAGTPVFATDQPPMVESVGPAGATFPAGDVAQLAHLLDNVLADTAYAAELRCETVRRAPLFSEAVYREALLRILEGAGIQSPR